MSPRRRFAAEGLGTALLLCAVVGSGIMGDRLSGGNAAIALLANTVATGAILVTLILGLAPLSGAHLNPIVTLVEASQGAFSWRLVPGYIVSQVSGALIGVVAAHFMFEEPIVSVSTHQRSGMSQGFSEFVATFGLITVILLCSHGRKRALPVAVGAYIASAYWFTASTSFANPAVTVARTLTNTFAGIAPADAPMFLIGQTLGAASATWFSRWLVPLREAAHDDQADRAVSLHG